MSQQTDGAVTDFVLYLRKSKGRAGIERQRRETTRYIERLGGRIVAEFVDKDSTAFAKIDADRRPERDDYTAMLQMLRADRGGRPLGVAAWHADRLHRDPGEAEDFIKVAAAGRHLVETCRSGSYELWTPTGRKRFRHDAVDAAYEVDHLIERIDAAKAEAAAEGRWLGGPRPFGFEGDGTAHRSAEAAAIAWGSDAVLAGTSMAAVVREWTARGLTTPRGNPWTVTEARRVLLRPRNAGRMVWRGEIVGAASWEPIVPESTWRAVVRTLTDPARRTTPGPERRWLGSGLYVCGVCSERRLRVHTFRGRSVEYPVYRCRDGAHVTRRADHLDRYVGEHVVARLSAPDARRLLVDEDGPDVQAAEARLLELRAELAEAETAVPGSVREARMLARLADDLAGQIAEIEATLIRPDRAAILRDLIEADDVAAEWERTPVDRQRAVLRLLFTVEVGPAPKGRPPGWRGGPYFHAESVEVRPV